MGRTVERQEEKVERNVAQDSPSDKELEEGRVVLERSFNGIPFVKLLQEWVETFIFSAARLHVFDNSVLLDHPSQRQGVVSEQEYDESEHPSTTCFDVVVQGARAQTDIGVFVSWRVNKHLRNVR